MGPWQSAFQRDIEALLDSFLGEELFKMWPCIVSISIFAMYSLWDFQGVEIKVLI